MVTGSSQPEGDICKPWASCKMTGSFSWADHIPYRRSCIADLEDIVLPATVLGTDYNLAFS